MKTTVGTKPILKIDKGLGVDTAVCDSGCKYIYWDIDRGALEEPAICEICETEVISGWHCMDGGGVYCDDCVIDIQDAGDYIQELESKVGVLQGIVSEMTTKLNAIICDLER